MKITQWAEYGTHCAIFLTKRLSTGDTSAVTAQEVAHELAIETDYAQQILQRLRKGGIVQSVRGPAGGYKLTKKPEEISLKDLLIATEGVTFDMICESRPIGEGCSNSSYACSLKSAWYSLKEVVEDHLEKISLAKLAEEHIRTKLITISEKKISDKEIRGNI